MLINGWNVPVKLKLQQTEQDPESPGSVFYVNFTGKIRSKKQLRVSRQEDRWAHQKVTITISFWPLV